MLTSKQRATLRGIASTYETIFQVGKGGISDTLVQQVSDALRKRELIKIHVLDNCPLSAREAAEELSEKTESDVVHRNPMWYRSSAAGWFCSSGIRKNRSLNSDAANRIVWRQL